MKHFAKTLALLAGFAALFANADPTPLDVGMRIAKYHVAYVLNADGSSAATIEKEVKVLKQQSIEALKQSSVSYSTSVERAEMLEAYTRKADGRRIDVPKSNYQMDISKGREADAPAISDRTQLSVIFPDVAVDDTLVMKYRITDIEPMFPGQFSITERFRKTTAFDDVAVRFDAPASLWTQYAVTGMTQSVAEEKDGRKIVEWTWSNPTPVKDKRKDFSSYDPDKEVGYAYSTFHSYAEIAEAYGTRARPKAVVTERVQKLADEVAAGKTDPREQARLLYEWVATHIDFAGNCVGVGAVVPRDQAFVLDNKMGDCKDHATLLQAMLSAKGIVSTQALVNSGSTYHLPRVPVVSMVNHVIVYVPSMDLFLDSTSSGTPFGMLPTGDAYKPVLLVDGYKDGMRTPAMRPDTNRQVAKTEITVKSDGSIAGTIRVASSGNFAVIGRERYRSMTDQERDEMLEQFYKRGRSTGFGKLESDDPKPLLTTFNYTVKLETEEFARMPGPGAFSIGPLYMTEAPVSLVSGMTEEETVAEEVACFGGSTREEYIIHLPKGMKILAVPKGVSVSNGTVTYKSTYERAGDKLLVTRELVDRTSTNVCPVSVQRDFTKIARAVVADLKKQVVYQ
jgi:transglutaminase-like putative cysteine protease